ncbi:MAG: DNA repair protein RecN [Prevotella sp.]|jgi:DNA repair protein RecN (Recombination protein N)
MLKHLYIKNFTLIDELDVDFYPGFSVITGETGAGKSIILGALHLLLGQRADTKQVKAGSQKCIVEALFDVSRYEMNSFFSQHDIDYDDGECILRREVNANGKSRAFINDTPVALSLMKELGEQLIDIHSQHQNLLLQKEDFQLNVVDIIAGNGAQRKRYRDAYDAYLQATKAYEVFEQHCRQNKENEEFLRFQCTELDKAELKEGEQAELEQQQQTLSHTEEIKHALYDAVHAISQEEQGCVDQLREASSKVSSILEVYPDVKGIADRLDSAYIELKDIADELESRVERVDFDPQQLEQVSARLDYLYSLEQRFHLSTEEELMAERNRLHGELETIDGGEEQLEELRRKAKEAFDRCMKEGKTLTETRKASALRVESEMKKRLVPLGIPHVRFSIEFKEKNCAPNGVDKVQFLFSANSSSPLQPVSQVASGGEIARVMLSLKAMISRAVKLPTIIFDEIDTGVSGRVAEKMAQIMQEMGENHRQVISITHLPQIAALGTTHYKVIKKESRNGTVSEMRKLSTEERVREVAQMLSGSDISQAAIDNARSLLRLDNNTNSNNI